jgi:hypothetical protein
VTYPELAYSTTAHVECRPCGIDWEVRATYENGAVFLLNEEYAVICPVCGRIEVDENMFERVAPDTLRDWRAQLTERNERIMESCVAAEYDWADAHADDEYEEWTKS